MTDRTLASNPVADTRHFSIVRKFQTSHVYSATFRWPNISRYWGYSPRQLPGVAIDDLGICQLH